MPGDFRAHVGSLVVRLRRSSLGILGAFAGWLIITCLLGAWTIAQHVIPLPAAAPHRQPAADRWQAWHFISPECGCSKAVAESLARRGIRRGWFEQVFLVADDVRLSQSLEGAGFKVIRISADSIEHEWGVKGVPWLILLSPEGGVAYTGGYAAGRPGVAGVKPDGSSLMDSVVRGDTVAAFPSYGCATSQALRQRLDPLGLKYRLSP